ncbi:DNA BINDING PROTEIN [Salix koriyanagi]|uniref:DNA BINDING PROTEIN n=1 Tax=Salix koriyanagi TaxID=2511006 RepID=A0A9Q0WSI8_9ROSI|nr:DNA BINDING PROTEIN [Salix koriyanagi]
MPLEDFHSSYLNDFPRKQVPLGPDHQASIPLWDKHIKKDKLVQLFNLNGSLLPESEHHIYKDNEEKLMGTRIIPMPDTKLQLCSRYEAGYGRSDCGCLDEGSGFMTWERRWHVNGPRKRNVFLTKLFIPGQHPWDQNFWKHLAQVFPDRTTKEIVNYYFNVFMLRKRAAQNRSNPLDIDSDDDEFPQIQRGSYFQAVEADEDSDLESPADQYDHADLEEDILEDDDNDGNDGGGDFDGDLGDASGDTTGEGSGIDYYSEAIDMNCIDPAVKHMNKNAGSDGVDFTVQDDSCMSFEFQADKVDPCASGDTRAALHVNRGGTNDHSKCLPSEIDGCHDDVDQVYLLEPCDTKVWDARCLSPIRGVDLLPTSNIIEEIFGQGACEDQTRDVNRIS